MGTDMGVYRPVGVVSLIRTGEGPAVKTPENGHPVGAARDEFLRISLTGLSKGD
jgi:hypothetical protein